MPVIPEAPAPLEGADKAALRKSALDRRKALPKDIRQRFAERLAREGLALAKRFGATTVSAFSAIGDEPDTLPLLEALAHGGFQTALPITVGRGSALIFRLWRPGEPTRAGQMNIKEPLPSALEVDPDLLFAPLAVFDRRGNRIGYGAGHYDRTLRALRAKGRAIAVGVAFSVCEAAAVPVEAHDERLDFVLTERELIATG